MKDLNVPTVNILKESLGQKLHIWQWFLGYDTEGIGGTKKIVNWDFSKKIMHQKQHK